MNDSLRGSLNSSGHNGAEEFLDLQRVYRSVVRYRWGIVGLALTVALCTALYVMSLQPIYQASASILLESAEANVVNVEEVYSLDTRNYNYTRTQFEILKSRDLAQRVVHILKLHKHPAFVSSSEDVEAPWYYLDLRALLPASKKEPPIQLTEQEQEALDIEAATEAVVYGLGISPVEYSYVVYLSFESSDPVLAASVTNTLAQEFIDGNLDNRLAGTLQATEWLGERLEDLKENLRKSEAQLQSFRDREGLVDIGGITGLGGNELKALSQRLQEANKARIGAQNIKEDVQGLDNASTDELMTIPAVLQHQLLRELKREQSKVERKVAELGKRYGPKHPKMVGARSDLSAANKELGREVRKVVSGISREYEVALRNEQQLQSIWETRKSEMQDFNRVEFQLRELQREVEANRQLYDIFFTRIKNVSQTGGFEKPHASIIDKAVVPTSAIRPNKKRSVVLALILGVILGCAVAVLLDILDNTIKLPDDVLEKLGSPLLGSIPLQKLDKNGDFEQYWQNSQSYYAESIRTIRTGIVLSGLDNPAKIILVTSTVPGEGKSTVALNLGAALAQMENTLVIGADLRRPSLARKCNLAPNHYGLSHFVSGTADLDDCIEHLPDLQMHIMPAGVIPTNPLEMISSKHFVDALAVLGERFDRIVVDSAPVQAVSDALILASYADSIVYVLKADSTSATQVMKGIESVVASNNALTGVVLNCLDTSKSRGYYGDNYDQYGENYQSSKTS